MALYVIQQYQSIMLYGLKADVVDGWMGVQRACRRDPTKADKMAKEALSEDSPSLHSI